MSRTCTVCNHKDIEKINGLLLSGESYRDIAGQFDVSKSALERHKDCHIPDALLKAEYDIGASIKCNVQDIDAKIKSYLEQAYDSGDLRVVHFYRNTPMLASGIKGIRVRLRN